MCILTLQWFVSVHSGNKASTDTTNTTTFDSTIRNIIAIISFVQAKNVYAGNDLYLYKSNKKI